MEWVALPSSRGSSRPRDRTHISCVSCIAGGFFTAESLGKPLNTLKSMFILLGKYENVLSELLITSHQSETIVLYQ